jgi:hypothetical protein
MNSCSLLVVPGWLALASTAFAQQPAPEANLEAGGLRPPEAIDAGEPEPQDPEAAVEGDLERADREDAGRGLEWFWLNAEVGVEHLGLHTFKDNQLVAPELVKTTQTGLVYGAGVGLRLLAFTVGARFRLGSFSDWQLWTLMAEGALHIPLGKLEPYFTLGLGYASLGSFSASSPSASEADARGFSGRLGFGMDFYLSNTLSIGANLTGDALFLSRAAVAGADGGEAAIYASDGSGIGAGASLTCVLGLHF